MAAIRETFFVECEEQLGELERGLLALEAGEGEADTVNAVFRAVHSIKGGGGAFALEDLVRYAHVFETTLDGFRAGRLSMDLIGIRTMLQAADVLADLVHAARDGVNCDQNRVDASVAELTKLAGKDKIAAPVSDGDIEGLSFEPVQIEFGQPDPVDLSSDLVSDSVWNIRFSPRAEMYAHANETGLILRELARLGSLEVQLDASGLPDLSTLDPEGAYLTWNIRLTGGCDLRQIRDVFEWVEEDCTLTVEQVQPEADVKEEAETAPAPIDVAALLGLIGKVEDAPAPIEVEAPADGMAVIAGNSAPAMSGAPKTTEPGATIRVDLQRVDRLIDLVGELVINEAMLNQRVLEAGFARASGMATAMDGLSQLTREIQDSVMAIRAQPVRSVFQRMPRLVREVAAMTGKSVRLITEGEGTEVDKTVVERLSDPLTHMIRNAIDHGLESPETRVAMGKPKEGVVRLSALHRSGRIVIEVTDDGAGLDRVRIRAKAIDKGLIAPDTLLSDDETDNLIFMPGFSTAATISDISGRGVGLDVVKRSVQALGGRISITSNPGHGSTFTLSLPLTLAVLDGMVVSVAGHILIVPLGPIVETLQPAPGQTHRLGAQGRVVALRGGYIPAVDVGVTLGFREREETPDRAVAILVEGEAGDRIVLQVDEIQGQRQIVIKSLETNYGAVPGIAAATVMGDGRVALILDVDAVIAASRTDGIVSRPVSVSVEPQLMSVG